MLHERIAMSARLGRVLAVSALFLAAQSLLANTITVNSNLDTTTNDGACTLREAIIAANTNTASGGSAGECGAGAAGLDTIAFSIGTGATTITPATALPNITEPVTINGYTQPGGSAANTSASADNSTHLITISGTLVPSGGGAGLTLAAGSAGSTIRGLVVNKFGDDGILVQSSNNTIAGNHVGTDAAGTSTTLGNGSSGVTVKTGTGSANGNVIGGTAPADRNLISGNSGPQVAIFSFGTGVADNATLAGNLIGPNAAATGVVGPIGGTGVYLSRANNTTIGGTTGTTPGGACTGSCNVISGLGIGIEFFPASVASDTSNNVISGNFIGPNGAGTAALGNSTYGIYFNGVGATLVGGTTPAARNVISGVGSGNSIGILVQNGQPAAVTTIQGNYIGTNSAGTAALGNGGYGIRAVLTSSVLIGGTTGLTPGACTGACNVVAGNGFGTPGQNDGIYLGDIDHSFVQGNFIGVGADGSALGNSGWGIAELPIGFGSNGFNTIGAATSGGAGGNIIANNGAGLAVSGGVLIGSYNNSVLSNSIYNNVATTTSISIDLGGNGPTADDSCDADAGSNTEQNFPVLTSATTTGSQTTINGTLNSTASQTFTVELFSSPTGSYPQARTYLGTTPVSTNGACNGSFTVTVPVGVPTSDVITATATNSAGNTSEVSASIPVTLGAPTVGKAFSPASVAAGATSTLTITLTNPNSAAITSAAFTDTYPANLINATPSNVVTTCGGAATAANGGGSVALTGGTIPANGSCTVTVSVLSNTPNSYLNTIGAGALTTSNAGSNAAAASFTLDVTAPPSISKTFNINPISVGTNSFLIITLTNPNAVPMTSAAFTDTYPSGLVNTATPNASTTCGAGVATAAAGGSSIALSGGTIPASGNCTVSVNVTATSSGNLLNTIAAGALTTSGGSNTSAGSDTLVVLAPPTVTKSFTPAGIAPGGTSTLTITLSNSNGSAVSNVAMTDTYPAAITNAATPNGATTCGGTVTASAGGGSVALSTGTIPANGNCTVTVNVTDSTAGASTNTINAGDVTSSASTNTVAASAALTVNSPPAVAKAFSPTTIGSGGTSVLTITLSNANPVALTGAAFTDSYPAGLVNAAAPAASTTCTGGIVTAAAGGGSVSLSGGTIPASGSCTVTVSVTSSTPNVYNNSIAPGGVTTSDSGASNAAANGALTVSALSPPSVAKAFSPTSITVGSTSTLTITLSNANGTAITGVAFTDSYPAGLVNAAGGGSTTCSGGSVTAVAGTGSAALSGASIPASGSCTVTVLVTSVAASSYANTIPIGGVTSTNTGPNGVAATATLTVNALNPPSVAKSFTPSSFGPGGTSTLTITLSNTNATPLAGASFTDTYPSGLVNAPAPAAATTCGGVVTAAPGGGSVALSGGTIPASGSCTVTVVVTAPVGSYVNTIPAGGVTTTLAGPNASAATTTLNATAVVPAVPTMSTLALAALAALLAMAAAIALRLR